MTGYSVTLRQWRDSDLEPFAAMNADPEVMRYFLNPQTHDESLAALAQPAVAQFNGAPRFHPRPSR